MYAMLDFETFGSKPNTIVLNLGVCLFDKDGIHAEKLYSFDIQDQIHRGRSFDWSTLQWWMTQSDEARSQFKVNEGRITLEEWGADFTEFCKRGCELQKRGLDDLRVVGNGANFDVSLAEQIYKQELRQETPWKFWNVTCYRTLHNFFDLKGQMKREGTHHNALDDAKYQAKTMINFLNNARAQWRVKKV